MSDDKTRILSPDDLARIAALADGGDDKTRILSADEASRLVAAVDGGEEAGAGSVPVVSDRAPGRSASGATRDARGRDRPPPRLVGDRIVFYCANGHRIAVDRSLAGKKGNCSKQGCGVPVVIPSPPGVAEVAEGTVEPEQPTSAGFPLPTLADEGPPADAESPDGTAPGTNAEFQFETGPVAAPAQPPPPPPPPAAGSWPGGASAGGEPLPGFGIEAAPAASWGGFDEADVDHPTARLVARLWLERAHGGIVEVHLSGGSVIMPEWYDARWSCGSHALFAAQAADGTVTLTAVAWDQIQSVVVRKVQGTPDGMFEG